MSLSIDERLEKFVRYTELKQLVYNISALQQERGFHSLSVLSLFPGEGKTLFCASLAWVYSETFRTKVLAVDTTTLYNKDSLILRECINGSVPMVEVRNLEQLRNTTMMERPVLAEVGPPKGVLYQPEVVHTKSFPSAITKEDDFSLLKRVIEDRSKQYGLVLLDTPPLNAKNRSNVDPLLVARMSDAAVVMVSQKLLSEPKLGVSLKVLEDPKIHLIGVVANEDYSR